MSAMASMVKNGSAVRLSKVVIQRSQTAQPLVHDVVSNQLVYKLETFRTNLIGLFRRVLSDFF